MARIASDATECGGTGSSELVVIGLFGFFGCLAGPVFDGLHTIQDSVSLAAWFERAADRQGSPIE